MDKSDVIANLQNRIHYWQNKLSNTKNAAEAAVLLDKINSAKKEILELNMDTQVQEINHQLDAPALADSSTINNNLERGQIMNSGDVFVSML